MGVQAMAKLAFTEGKIKGLSFKNRMIMAALDTGYGEKGLFSSRDIEFYRKRAMGGAAALTIPIKISDKAGVLAMHSFSSYEMIGNCRILSEIMQQNNCRFILQLFYKGFSDPKKEIPILSEQMLQSIVSDFRRAAMRAQEGGAEAVEINCGDGYLLSQFISPLTNLRTDNFGGEEENRIRFPLLVLKAVRNALGKDFPIIVRLCGAQLMRGGYDVEFTQRFCRRLEKEGLTDAIAVSAGWYESEIPTSFYQVPDGGFSFLADAVKRVVNCPVIAETGVVKPKTGEDMLQRGICDFIGTARGFLADAEFVNKMENKKSYNPCQRCNTCLNQMLDGKEAVCAYNPETGKEYLENTHRKIATAKKILVIGGGPAGMMAAKKASQRGYKTTLVLKENKLGGNLNLAALAPGKQDIFLFIENLKQELLELEVDIQYETEVDGSFAVAFEPYFVVVAVGSVPVTLSIPGISNENVIQSNDLFQGDMELFTKLKKGKAVIIGGGGSGLEAAAFLSEKAMVNDLSLQMLNQYKNIDYFKTFKPLDITVIEKSGEIGSDLKREKWIIEKELLDYGVNFLVNTEVKEIVGDAVLAEMNKGVIKVKADNVILAMGENPAQVILTEELENQRISYSKIGDADQPGGVFNALHSAYDLFLRLYLA